MSIEHAFQQLRREVEGEQLTGVAEQLKSASDAIDARLDEHEQLSEFAQSVSTRNGGPVADAAEAYLQAGSDTLMSWSSVLATVNGYLSGDISREAALDTIDGALRQYAEVEEARQNFLESKSSVSVPPALLLVGEDELEVPLGTTRTASLQLQNPSNDAITYISVSIDADVDAHVEPSQIGRLDADGQSTIEITSAAGQEGIHEAVISAEGDGISTSTEFEIIVGSTAAYVERALEQLKSMDVKLDVEIEKKGDNSPPQNVLANAIQSLETIHGDLQNSSSRKGRGKEHVVDNKIQVVVQKLETFRRLLEKLGGNPGNGKGPTPGLDEGRAASLRYDAGAVIETLETGIEASK